MAARRPHTTHSSTSPSSTSTTFADLGVPAALTSALAANGITTPFPIQTATLPDSLAGRDVLGRGRTGSGKTYAFALPLLTRLAASTAPRRPGRPRALDPGPHPRTGHPDRGGDRPAGQGAVAAHADRLRRCGRQPADLRPARRCRHPRGLPGPARRPRQDRPRHASTRSRSPCSTRPTTWPTSVSCPSSGVCSTRPRGPASGCSSRPRSTPASTSWCGATSPTRSPTASTRRCRRSRRCRTTCCMSNHDDRLPVLVDLAAAPGRTLVFTRTKRGAKTLTRQLIAAGVPAVELHGNLAQNRAQPQPARLLRRHREHVGCHRHRGPRHPRRRHRPGHPRRSAGGAQGIPAPLRSYRPGRRERHCDHADDRRPGRRRARPDPQGGHRADDHATSAGPSACSPALHPVNGRSSRHRSTIRPRLSRHGTAPRVETQSHVPPPCLAPGACYRPRRHRCGPAPAEVAVRWQPHLPARQARPPFPLGPGCD